MSIVQLRFSCWTGIQPNIILTLSPVSIIVFVGLSGSLWVAEGRWVCSVFVSLCQSFTIAEGLSGAESHFLFLLSIFQGRWNKTCFYLSDSVYMGLYRVADGRRRSLPIFLIVFPFFHGLPKTVRPSATHKDRWRPTKTVWKPCFKPYEITNLRIFYCAKIICI